MGAMVKMVKMVKSAGTPMVVMAEEVATPRTKMRKRNGN